MVDVFLLYYFSIVMSNLIQALNHGGFLFFYYIESILPSPVNARKSMAKNTKIKSTKAF
jgi:hypothetical protein